MEMRLRDVCFLSLLASLLAVTSSHNHGRLTKHLLKKRSTSGQHCDSGEVESQFYCYLSDDCVPLEWVCDHDDDCDNGEDELECNFSTTCESDQFFCGSNEPRSTQCIPSNWVCDGEPDCQLGADEHNCQPAPVL